MTAVEFFESEDPDFDTSDSLKCYYKKVITDFAQRYHDHEMKPKDNEFCECEFVIIRRDQKTQKAYCFKCKKEIQE